MLLCVVMHDRTRRDTGKHGMPLRKVPLAARAGTVFPRLFRDRIRSDAGAYAGQSRMLLRERPMVRRLRDRRQNRYYGSGKDHERGGEGTGPLFVLC